MKRLLLRPYSLLSLAAVALAFSFPGYHLFPLAWLALAPLIHQNWEAPPKTAALRFLFTGWLFHTLLLQWLAANVFWAGGWALVGMQMLCLLLAAFWAVTGYAWRWSVLRIPGLPPAPVLALFWLAMEWLQATLFSGFGWSALGYSQGPNLPLIQWAAFGGVSLVSCLIVLANALIAQSILSPGRRALPLLSTAVIIIGAHSLGYGLLKSTPETAFQVGLYQANYSQEMKRDSDFTRLMVEMAAAQSSLLASQEKVDLLVWPEALVTDDYRLNPDLLNIMRELTVSTRTPLFTGATRMGENGEDFNSSVLIDAQGEVTAHYDKVHLAPFGEYVPAWIPFVEQVVPGGVTAGSEQRLIELNGSPMGPLICFEVLFSRLSTQLRRMGAEYLVVITNLGWFGVSSAIGQELEIARLRAVETRLPLIHSANTGISGVFDPYGRFTPINRVVRGNNVVPIREGITAHQTQGHRLTGVLPVSAPAPHPFPQGPVLLPWGALVLSLAVLAAAGLSARRNVSQT